MVGTWQLVSWLVFEDSVSYSTERGVDFLTLHSQLLVGSQVTTMVSNSNGTEQRVFLVESYLLKNKSYERCVYTNLDIVSLVLQYFQNNMCHLFRKCQETVSVFNRKKNRKKSVLIDEKLSDIRARMEQSPKKYLHQLAQECSISKAST